MAFLPPSGGVSRLSFSGSSPGIPCRRSCGFQGAVLDLAIKIATQQPEPDHPFRDGLGSGLLCSDKKVKNLLRSTAQTRTFENTLISAACKKKQGKLWQKERGPDGAGPLDRMMRCSKTSAAFITVFKNSADQNGIFMICSLRILLRWENRIKQKDKVSAGKIRTRR